MSEMSKMAEKLDLHGFVKNVKSAINPEMAIPADEKENPVNYRIMRLVKLLDDMAVMRKAMDRDFDRLDTNLRELLIELNPQVFEKAKMESKEKPKAEMDPEPMMDEAAKAEVDKKDMSEEKMDEKKDE